MTVTSMPGVQRCVLLRPTGAAAPHLDAKVTAGMNTAAEKARFIADAHALLKAVVGPELSVATYVVVDELPADAWGYDGLTQAHRASALALAK